MEGRSRLLRLSRLAFGKHLVLNRETINGKHYREARHAANQ